MPARSFVTRDGEKVSFISTDIEIQITTNANFGVGAFLLAACEMVRFSETK